MSRKVWIKVGLAAACVIGIFAVWTLAFVNPVIMDYTQNKMEAMTVKAVSLSVNGVMEMSSYGSLIDIKHDSNGKIQSLTADAVKMNAISSKIATQAQKELETLAEKGITVPLGTFSGWPVLTGVGPDITLRVVPVGSVNCNFVSEFIAAGINQTRHRIIMNAHCVVTLVIPLASRRVEINIEALLAESIIVGDVPEFMLTK